MCGFLLCPDTPHFRNRFDAALDRMGYRGADGFRGIQSRGGWLLGHIRLAIQTDADFGEQPFSQVDRSFAFVGEIFSRDHKPLDPGLTEEQVLYEALKSPYLKDFMRLDGFWSVAEVHDGGHARVLTDHLGIKPVYYWAAFDIFCSEIEPMFELMGTRASFDEVYLSNCIKFGYDYSGRTPYVGITQVAPGTVMVRQPTRMNNSFAPENYWVWGWVKPLSHGGFPSLELGAALTQSVLSRASAVRHRTVGMLLSGGLDSMIVYGILKEADLLKDVLVYSVENEESHFLPPGVELLPVEQPTLREAVQVMQAPLDLGSLLPQIQLARALGEKGCRVCLTGDGADELFGGYRRAREYDSQASDVFCELPYYHLPRLDRVHMKSTTEVRSPFLAPAVVALALRLPRDSRIDKDILKRTFGHLVPPEVLSRPKHPLKGPAYLTDPLAHRAQLVEAFRNEHQN